MKKRAFILIVTGVMAFCGSPSQVEKKTEDGIEIVVNRMKSDTGSRLFTLNEESVIDLEEDIWAESGLTDIWGFDIDSQGNIYIFKPPMTAGDRIIKFNRNGEFILSFAPPGQGPGEIQSPSYQKMNSQEELLVSDLGQSKIIRFSRDGQVIDERHIDSFPFSLGSLVFLLENGHYIIRRTLSDPASGVLYLALSLYDGNFDEIKELDKFKIVQPIRADRVRLPMHVSVWCASYNKIYVGNEKNGYEIHVYDFDGKLRQKIRKEHEPVWIGQNYKKSIEEKLDDAPEALKSKIYFPEYFPPFSYLFTDNEGNLYVKIFKEGDRPKERLFDVFNPEGVFMGTVSLEVHVNDPFFTPGAPFDSWVACLKNDRFYALREKDSGYKEFVVYKVE